ASWRLEPRATTLPRERERESGRDQDDETIGDDLRKHDLRWHDRHDQQMLDCSLLTLAYERRSSQDHSERGDVVDDLHDRGEPIGIEVRIEIGVDYDINGGAHGRLRAVQEFGRLVRNDGLDVDGAIACLGHCGGVDIQLQGGPAAGQQVGLEGGWDVQDENE